MYIDEMKSFVAYIWWKLQVHRMLMYVSPLGSFLSYYE